ncbi:MAG: MFS transporter [Acidobacteriota bacterium]|nr:MFS transporter [Acidobacteriota bacterium]
MASAGRALKVSEIIDERPLSRFQKNTILLCGLVLVLDGFDTQSIGFLAPSIADSLHLRIGTFGPVFSAALFGLMIASMIAGPIADRVGRKVPIVFATLTFATFAIATARAATFEQLVVFRFLTGLGLGGAIPNVVALTTEYAPKRLQKIVVSMLFCSMPLGALLGGLVSTVLLPRFGWQSVFYAGGVLPLCVALVLIWVLPESIRFLGNSSKDQTAIRRILWRIAPEVADSGVDFAPSVEDRPRQKIPVIQLFTEGRAMGTVLLWIPFFMNLLMLYFIVTWLPALLRRSHMPPMAGILAVSIFSLGGIIGSLLQGRIMVARGVSGVLLAEFGLSLVLIGTLGSVVSFPLMMAITFVLGCLIQGAQAGLNALAATFYPTSMRSTGVGWALGIGRIGSIAGPILGGMMVSRAWALRQILFAGAVPALVAVLAVLASRGLGDSTNPYGSKTGGSER